MCDQGTRLTPRDAPPCDPGIIAASASCMLIGTSELLRPTPIIYICAGRGLCRQAQVGVKTAVTRARAQHKPITFRDPLDRLLRTCAGSCQKTALMPRAGSGILKTWEPAGARTLACAPPWTCLT